MKQEQHKLNVTYFFITNKEALSSYRCTKNVESGVKRHNPISYAT